MTRANGYTPTSVGAGLVHSLWDQPLTLPVTADQLDTCWGKPRFKVAVYTRGATC
jgi:hypothetical protein